MKYSCSNFSKEELRVLYTVARVAAEGVENPDTLCEGLDSLEDHTGFMSPAVGLLHAGSLRLISSLSAEEVKRFEPAHKSVLDRKRGFVQAGFSREKIISLPLGSTLYAIPIYLEGDIVGALTVLCREVANREDLDRGFSFLTALADLLAGTFIKKIRSQTSLLELKVENEELKRTLNQLEEAGKTPEIIGESQRIKSVFREIAQVAKSDITVLITGETGTGKELVARAIHSKSDRCDGPFMAVNCGALSEMILESELFGHEKGAYTGAHASREGIFVAARGGTIFLDEIGEMSLSAQSRLLRVLQEHEVTPLGSTRPQPIDVRVLCATNRDLREMVSEKRFREDLLYRINPFHIEMPPLRDRGDDIPLIAQSMLLEVAGKRGEKKSFSPESLSILCSYEWPGNIRELRNVVERCAILSLGALITPDHLPPSLQGEKVFAKTYEERVEAFERELILDALKKCDGNQRRAAEYLGTTKRIIQYNCKKLNIISSEFRTT